MAATLCQLFSRFTKARQDRLAGGLLHPDAPEQQALEHLLALPELAKADEILRRALTDPYLPAPMLDRTLFADVTGMRFFIRKDRPDLQPVLARELIEWCAAFVRIRDDLITGFHLATVTCIPLDGLRHPLPETQWCDLCGRCCEIGGVPPQPPAGITHPNHWAGLLAGTTLSNQQLCPFLLQYFGEPRYFCSIHQIKPLACRSFDLLDCRRRLADRGLHAPASSAAADRRAGPESKSGERSTILSRRPPSC